MYRVELGRTYEWWFLEMPVPVVLWLAGVVLEGLGITLLYSLERLLVGRF